MCGRYTNRLTWSEIVKLYRITSRQPALNLQPRYNIAPTQDVAAVRRAAGSADRELAMLRWGLVPSWAKDIAIGARMINARAETLAEKPSFRSAFKSRRCLIVADGFYEWQKQPKGPKQPFLIGLKDGEPFAFAGLWERWEKSPDDKPVESCTIVTTEANDLLKPIHDRMPVILAPDDYDAWLDVAGNSPDKARALLQPFPSERMAMSSVSTRVNSVRNDDPTCIEAA